MYNIILVCEHGASTGMMTDRIKDAAARTRYRCDC